MVQVKAVSAASLLAVELIIVSAKFNINTSRLITKAMYLAAIYFTEPSSPTYMIGIIFAIFEEATEE